MKRGHGSIALLAVIALWQLVVLLFNAQWLIGPIDIVLAYAEPTFSSKLLEAYMQTSVRALVGFFLGLLAGITLGLLVSLKSWAVEFMEVVASLAISVPSIAWIPLLIASIGVDEFKLPIAASFLCSFPTIFYQTVSAIRSIDPEEVMVARSLGAKGFYLWKTIVVPAIIEKVFPAVKVEAAMVWKTVFAAEMVAVPSGLGYLAMVYADLLDLKHVAAIVAVLALTVALIVRVVDFIEKRVLSTRGLGVEPWYFTLEL